MVLVSRMEKVSGSTRGEVVINGACGGGIAGGTRDRCHFFRGTGGGGRLVDGSSEGGSVGGTGEGLVGAAGG
ncbi:hypothetical protein DPV78_008506 [Talaromyces pinophilus]|nr:hypothetical protein DPV78_008506 [Talaromyces pinophilus]